MHHSVVTRELPPFEHVNLQTAIDAWSAHAGRTVEVRGIALPPHYGGLSLQQLVAGEALPPLRLTAPALADLPNGPESTLGCLRLALLLVTDHSGRYIVMIKGPSEHEPSLQIEVAGLPVGQAQRLLAELDQLRADLNVYRGHLLDVSLDPMGRVILSLRRPARHHQRRRRAARHRAGACRAACPRRRRPPGGAAGRRAAPQARPAALRPSRHRQNAHDALPAGPDDQLHAPGPYRPLPGRRGRGHRPGPRPAARGHRARGCRPGRRGTLARPGVEPGPVRLARRHGRSSPRRRPAVPADHQPRRPAGTRPGRPAGAGRRRSRDRPAGRPGPGTPADALRPERARWR